MQETPDIEDLVNRYLDLWQEQWSLMATDPDLAYAIARYLELFEPFYDLVAQQGQKKQGELYQRGQETSTIGPELSSRTTTAGIASDVGRAKLDELLERIARLEERVAEMASKTGESGPTDNS